MVGEKCLNVMGVKGFSWLFFFQYYDVVCGIVIDYMYGVFFGV